MGSADYTIIWLLPGAVVGYLSGHLLDLEIHLAFYRCLRGADCVGSAD